MEERQESITITAPIIQHEISVSGFYNFPSAMFDDDQASRVEQGTLADGAQGCRNQTLVIGRIDKDQIELFAGLVELA